MIADFVGLFVKGGGQLLVDALESGPGSKHSTQQVAACRLRSSAPGADRRYHGELAIEAANFVDQRRDDLSGRPVKALGIARSCHAI